MENLIYKTSMCTACQIASKDEPSEEDMEHRNRYCIGKKGPKIHYHERICLLGSLHWPRIRTRTTGHNSQLAGYSFTY